MNSSHNTHTPTHKPCLEERVGWVRAHPAHDADGNFQLMCERILLLHFCLFIGDSSFALRLDVDKSCGAPKGRVSDQMMNWGGGGGVSQVLSQYFLQTLSEQ